jgi:DNA-binding GntR family transcriptional regulator
MHGSNLMTMPNSALKNTRREASASVKVEEYIKNALYTGRLAPRERIIEGVIAHRLGVSRGPVREVLLRLEAEGLLTITSRRGTFVRDFSLEEVRLILKMRAKLEALAVWYMRQRMTRKDEATLHKRLQRMKSAAAKGDDEEFFYADMGLHQTIWELSGEGRLFRMLSRVMSPVIFQIARSYSSQWPIAQRYENHRAYCEMILTTPLSQVDRAVERYFDKLYHPISSVKVPNGDERPERPLVPIRWAR